MAIVANADRVAQQGFVTTAAMHTAKNVLTLLTTKEIDGGTLGLNGDRLVRDGKNIQTMGNLFTLIHGPSRPHGRNQLN